MFYRSMIVFSAPGGQAAERVIREHEVYRPTLLPGLEVPLSELLEAADRLGESDPSRVD